MRALVLATLLLATGCDGECFDEDPDNDYETSCDENGRDEYRGESYRAYAFAGADDHFVALVTYNDFRQVESTSEHWLVGLDADGTVVSVTDTAFTLESTAAAADGHGSMVVVAGDAHFLRDGEEVRSVAVGADVGVAFGAGTYWFAKVTNTATRELVRYGATGELLETITLTDDGALSADLPSLATDPLGDYLAAGWLLTRTSSFVVAVDRIHGNLATPFVIEELASPGLQRRAWMSPVAMRENTIAVVYALEGEAPTIALLSPDNQVTTKRFDFSNCTGYGAQFIGTPYGYLLTCSNRFVVFDATGVLREISSAPTYAKTATARDAALVLAGTQDGSIETRKLSNSVGDPSVVFDGHSTSVGCSTTGSSASWLVGLALFAVRRRRAGR